MISRETKEQKAPEESRAEKNMTYRQYTYPLVFMHDITFVPALMTIMTSSMPILQFVSYVIFTARSSSDGIDGLKEKAELLLLYRNHY
jgi:hypothetical protein